MVISRPARGRPRRRPRRRGRRRDGCHRGRDGGDLDGHARPDAATFSPPQLGLRAERAVDYVGEKASMFSFFTNFYTIILRKRGSALPKIMIEIVLATGLGVVAYLLTEDGICGKHGAEKCKGFFLPPSTSREKGHDDRRTPRIPRRLPQPDRLGHVHGGAQRGGPSGRDEPLPRSNCSPSSDAASRRAFRSTIWRPVRAAPHRGPARRPTPYQKE